MASRYFSGNAAEFYMTARTYLKSRIELWKLSLLEKVSLAGTFFLSSVFMIVISAFCLLFLSIGFAYWYGYKTGDTATGFLIIAGLFVVFGILFIIGSKFLVKRQVSRKLTSIVYDEKQPEEMKEI
jgi:integral membrane sensor domain MASE1